MFRINDDLSIEITRGDAVEFTVTAQENGENHVFKIGDVVRFKVFEKKGCDCVVLQKDFGVESDTEEVTIVLEEVDTKIGELIHKPKDYWYEVELNPDTLPYTIIGYDADGAKVFKLYPEGRDLGADPITPEDIPFVDKELDITSHNPVENQTITKKFSEVYDAIQKNADTVTQELGNKLSLGGGTMTGNLSMGGKKLTWLADPENDADAVNLGYANRTYAPKTHLEDYQNPHNVTAAQVGARPNTWTPSANDVGAVPTTRKVNNKALSSDITLSASDVGARPDTWMPTASDVSAVPTTRKVNNKALSADIALSAGDVGARPDTWMPTAADVGALTALAGISIPSGADLNTYTTPGAYRSSSGTVSKTLSNTPYSGTGFRLNVFNTTTNNQIMQEIKCNAASSRVYRRAGSYDNEAWVFQPWYQVVQTTQSMNDYVVAQGTANGWCWRKWASGLGECWGGITGTTASSALLSRGYPFSFNDVFAIQCTKLYTGDTYGYEYYLQPMREVFHIYVRKAGDTSGAWIADGTEVSCQVYVCGTYA